MSLSLLSSSKGCLNWYSFEYFLFLLQKPTTVGKIVIVATIRGGAGGGGNGDSMTTIHSTLKHTIQN